MLSNFLNLAVSAGECQRDQAGHKPDLRGEQELLAEKLALKYDACQFCSSSLIRPSGIGTPY
jgi:hypothetical protein